MTDRELREQLNVTKRMLEIDHGRALKHGTPEEAEAYYQAIQDLDTALVYNWRTDGTVDGLAEEFINESRKARRAGYEEATKLDERMERTRQQYGSHSVWDHFGPVVFFREVKRSMKRWLA